MIEKKLYLTIFELFKEGKNPNQISKELSMSKQKLHYYTHKLKELGYIQKIGYGTWEVKKNTLNTLEFKKDKRIRGHAFIWKIKVPKEIKDWKELLNSKNIKYNLVGKEKFPRLIINNKKIWLGKKNIIIYENKSFYANNSINSRKYAAESLLCCLGALYRKLGLNVSRHVFQPSREHYGMIKNDLARQCNKNGEKIIIHDDLEGQWLWIDDSESLGELETGGSKAVVRSKQVQTWWNSNKKHNFEVDADFTLGALNKLSLAQVESNRQLLEYQKQNKEHLTLIQEYRKESQENQKLIKELLKKIK